MTFDRRGDEEKTIYRYDAGGRTFKKAAVFLVILAVFLAIFGIIWLTILN
ncbi:MAG: hypothetical protein V3S48_01475 [Candidatus Neomarinimicrobiota bacterium]